MLKKRALLSVSDKTGIIQFAENLVRCGYEIISTGGTAKTLADAGIEVVHVSDITGFPECLDGRVKTLHPRVHAGILAVRDNKNHMMQLSELGIELIDIVAINLYPFKATIKKEDVALPEAIENIDIGGPTMLRAAAKNYQDVMVVIDPADYESLIEKIESESVTPQYKFYLAQKVFSATAAYDALIASYLKSQMEDAPLFDDTLTITYEKAEDLRYGENPHQQAAFYREIMPPLGTIAGAVQIHGKQLSYNNINDANGALDLLKEFTADNDFACAVAVKHANPCGVGIGAALKEAYDRAYSADPVSIYGGIVAVNKIVDKETAEEMAKIFLEIIIAPDFTEDAVEILSRKKNIRLLSIAHIKSAYTNKVMDQKKVAGGLLIQQLDCELYNKDDITVPTKRKPSMKEMEQLLFAWRVVKHVKSNAICLVKDLQTVGIGPGQTNRVTALKLAVEYAGEKAQGSVMGSDAYFPFKDSVEEAHKAGVTAIIQPGGSVRDQESIDLCDEYGIAMVFTGMRHFKH